MAESVTVNVNSTSDILTAREKGREVARSAGFAASEQTFIATAISSIARNLVHQSTRGQIEVRAIEHGRRRGVAVTAQVIDQRPDAARPEPLLNGVRRLMDEVTVESPPDAPTVVTARKWLR